MSTLKEIVDSGVSCDPDQLRRLAAASRPCMVTCRDVWEWKEFRALAARLGIDLTLETRSLVLILSDWNGPPVVQHEWNAAADKSGKLNAPLPAGAGTGLIS